MPLVRRVCFGKQVYTYKMQSFQEEHFFQISGSQAKERAVTPTEDSGAARVLSNCSIALRKCKHPNAPCVCVLYAYLCFICLCVRMYLCMYVWRLEIFVRYLLLFSTLVFWDENSHWTWDSLIWLDWPGSPQNLPILHPLTHLQHWAYRWHYCTWLLCCAWDLSSGLCKCFILWASPQPGS